MPDQLDTISNVVNSLDIVDQRPCATDARDECHGQPTSSVKDSVIAADDSAPKDRNSAYFNYNKMPSYEQELVECDGDYNVPSLVFEPISYAVEAECNAKIEDDYEYEMELQHTENQMLDSLEFDRFNMQSIVVDGESVFGVAADDDSMNDNSEGDNSFEKFGTMADEIFTSPTMWIEREQKEASAAEPPPLTNNFDFDADFSQFASFDDPQPNEPTDSDLFIGNDTKSDNEINSDDALCTVYDDDKNDSGDENSHRFTSVKVTDANDTSSSSSNSDELAKCFDDAIDNAGDKDDFDDDDDFGDFSDFQQTTSAVSTTTTTYSNPAKSQISLKPIVDAQNEFNSILASMFPSTDASDSRACTEYPTESADSISNEITKQLQVVDETKANITNNNWKKSVSKSFLVKALGIDHRNIVSSRSRLY